ncbi:peptidase S49 serine-peptidase [Fadolivirus algeromassiliense]|jgi:hypothetical protein|uniref:Peptidase S49 serine-peptidase n=1 Tax=Fadolivirus FV1/VV64 TaxID=3070911 RepID=A0A7D3UQ42_9VIRU|nr:peptidase S49 serine-peptidase [Fadolivirus algeromassiliense]QKF94288.1 peptidase S49 serine-peptidase [Fadolivirus FV1/VV64]
MDLLFASIVWLSFILIYLLYSQQIKNDNPFNAFIIDLDLITTFFTKKSLIRLIHDIEQDTNSIIKIILNNSNKYIDNNIFISIDNEDQFIDVLYQCKTLKKELKLIIHSDGGIVSSSDIIVNAILNSNVKITSYIPFYARSAATILALATDEIVMDTFSHLTPTDPQILIEMDNRKSVYSSKVLIDFIDLKKNVNIKTNPKNDNVILSALDAKVLHNDNIVTVKRILLKRNILMKTHKKILNMFTSGNYSHHYPVYFEELKKLGFNVNNTIPENIKNLYSKLKVFL